MVTVVTFGLKVSRLTIEASDSFTLNDSEPSGIESSVIAMAKHDVGASSVSVMPSEKAIKSSPPEAASKVEL